MTKKLYSFYWDCGRMGFLDGLFVAEEEKINALIGKRIYFGEVLGKHSEIYGELEADDIKVIDIDEVAIEKIVAVTGETISGYNPLDYYEAEEEEYDEDADDEDDDE